MVEYHDIVPIWRTYKLDQVGNCDTYELIIVHHFITVNLEILLVNLSINS